ncbi:MAG: S-layer homology domain-containing protein [Defluviitaleaceae bacterium]|nr:S-layer homology domain-containing protein [Defluviitaleaceae bacterium]
MRNFIKKVICATLVISMTPVTVFAGAGTMGFFGGISEGLRMPTITARLLDPALNGRRNVAGEYEYSEMVFLSGEPSRFDGILLVAQGAGVTAAPYGTFAVTNTVVAGPTTGDTEIFRDIVYTVQWRREGNQVIKNYNATDWAEVILVDGTLFTLDFDQSFFVISIIEDHNPGIMFYRGLLSKRAVYFIGDTDETVVVEATGHIYGFDSPYSSTETQSLDVWVMAADWQMSYQIRPSVSVTTSLMYQATTPTAISFAGNYMHLMSNHSVAAYDIFVVPQPAHFIPTSGSFNIQTHTTHEMLPASDMSILQGHFAEQDISRLFAQQILSGSVAHFVPNQAMTRGEFTQALVRALRIEVPIIQPLGIFNRTQRIVFPDVLRERPEYAYIIAGHNAGLVHGRVDGNFHIDVPISREEAVATLIRGLGLENVVPNPIPITSLNDSLQISGWAAREMAAALELGLIAGDANGNFRPRDLITKSEAAALINRFIDYMREDLVRDYSERMVNFVW